MLYLGVFIKLRLASMNLLCSKDEVTLTALYCVVLKVSGMLLPIGTINNCKVYFLLHFILYSLFFILFFSSLYIVGVYQLS
ncbi:hypothetical protein BZA77DRAFT_311270 [Pyronema omphalodes]|nr:hypothetical protein BZA77DRAFT_311270 [Pyronema omphalodes]